MSAPEPTGHYCYCPHCEAMATASLVSKSGTKFHPVRTVQCPVGHIFVYSAVVVGRGFDYQAKPKKVKNGS